MRTLVVVDGRRIVEPREGVTDEGVSGEAIDGGLTHARIEFFELVHRGELLGVLEDVVDMRSCVRAEVFEDDER